MLAATPMAIASMTCVDPTGAMVQRWGEACMPGRCQCKPDQCVIQGQCIDKCVFKTLTGGTCAFSSCDKWRNATCTSLPGHTPCHGRVPTPRHMRPVHGRRL